MECRVCAQEGAFQRLRVLPAPHQHLDPTPCVCVCVCMCVLVVGGILPAPYQRLDPIPSVLRWGSVPPSSSSAPGPHPPCVCVCRGGECPPSSSPAPVPHPLCVCDWAGRVILPAPPQHLDPTLCVCVCVGGGPPGSPPAPGSFGGRAFSQPQNPRGHRPLACPGPRVQAGLLEQSEGQGPWPGKRHIPRTPKKPGQVFANTSKQQNSHQSNLEWSPQIQVCVHTSVSCTCAFVQRDTYRQTRRVFCPWLLGISSFLSLAAPPQSTF